MTACAACGASLGLIVADLGVMPPANALLASPDEPETAHPLRAAVCTACWLVQLVERIDPRAIFDDYSYFSGYSPSWVAHAAAFAQSAKAAFAIGADARVVEIASNDGTFLKPFKALGARVLGIEPARNVAAVAEAAGIPTRVAYFGVETARGVRAEFGAADLVIANNVLAHVPAMHDFVGGLAALVADDGRISIEFPHLLNLLREQQFDTIYHEHYFYLSLTAITPLFARHGLVIVDVEELPTHGGSLRVIARRGGATGPRVVALLARERAMGLDTPAPYRDLQPRMVAVRRAALDFLGRERAAGRRVAGYGAAAKGATFLNYCGIGHDQIAQVADASPHKQGRFMPGSRIPIVAPAALRADPPDTVLILAWNLRAEIALQLADLHARGTRFAVALPELKVW